ncbi:MAG: DegV family protein [Clostridia bacterium]|jgi:DegV family protein with EDD domain|nr:DegV family protein [Clostridia bacterium]
MEDYIISCSSTADLSKEHFEKIGVHYVCFHFMLDGKTYPDDLGQSVPFDKFYHMMAEGAMTSTSQVNIDEFVEYFGKMLDEGKDILHVELSSGLSGSYNSACAAAEMLREKYPGRKIYIVDSLGASSGYGLIMHTMARKRAEGMGIDELHSWVEKNKLKLHHWFFSTDLKYYVRGGRVSKTAGFFGSLLSICPMLNMDKAGHLIPRAKIRTKKRAIRDIVDRMEAHAEGGLDYSGECFISQSDFLEDAKEVARLVEERFPKLNGKVLINSIGTTIGSHTGPGTIALFFWGEERVD